MPKTKNDSKKKKKNIQEGFSQDLIEIADIINGMFFMKDGSVVKILEILPINFTEKTAAEQRAAVYNFAYGIKQGPKNAHIKVMRSEFDIQPFIQTVRTAMEEETDEDLLARVDDYLNNVISLQAKNAKRNRFFYIFEYEGDESGKKSDKFKEIYRDMQQVTLSVKNFMRSTGNFVIDHYDRNDIMSLLGIPYEFFNPVSRSTQTVKDRRDRVQDAQTYVAAKTHSNVTAPIDDLVAPRGVRFYPWDYMTIDGKFMTFLSLRQNSFPQQSVPGSFIASLMTGLEDCDIDIYYKEQHREHSLYLLDRVNVISQGVAMSNNVSQDKAAGLYDKAANAKYIRDCMTDGDENLYNVSVIITIRANSKEELDFTRSSYIRAMKMKSFYFETAFMKTQEYFRMVQPFMYINKEIFNDNCRNMTNRSLAAMYCFTAFEMYSDNGFCMGTMGGKNPTLFSFNNFDSNIFPNPHIFIMGTSGAGKTFTELMLTSRMRMHGIRTMFVLPLKGHEYKKAVYSCGGEFISLRPGASACVNIFEIRPKGNALDADEGEDEPSLLMSKVTSVITWFRLLCGEDRLSAEETGELNALIIHIYKKYGITNDNDSIFENKKAGVIRTMPTIQDLYDEVLDNQILYKRASILKAWVEGSCKNMNGQTNVDLSNKVLAFDVNENLIGKELLPAFMFIAFDICYSIAKEDELEKCAIALDEVWKLMTIQACAEQVFEMIKILRGYGSCVITATQDIEDCLNSPNGKAILTNSSIKLFLRLLPNELDTVETAVSFSETNKYDILNFPRGYGYFCYGTEKLVVHFMASDMEVELYSTDVEEKQKRKRKAKA